MAKPQYNGPWPRLRQQILTRDRHTCQLQLPGCTTHANTVDHITPIKHGGQWWNPTNLQAACTHCNTSKHDRQTPPPTTPPNPTRKY